MYAIVDRVARVFALLGGLVLSALVILTCLSIVGRSLNSALHSEMVQSVAGGLANKLLAMGVGPINGDFELVEVGMAFTIFAFLPFCQLNGAHASVDIFTARLPERANLLLRLVIEVVFAGVLILIAWQLFQGMESKRSSGQTSFLLQFPVWWGYAVALTGAVAAAFVSVSVAVLRLTEAVSGHRTVPPEQEADH